MTEDEMDGITNSMNMNLGKLQEMVRDIEAWHAWGHRELDTTWCLNNNDIFTEYKSVLLTGGVHRLDNFLIMQIY